MRERHVSSIAMEWKKDMMQLHSGGRMEEKRRSLYERHAYGVCIKHCHKEGTALMKSERLT